MDDKSAVKAKGLWEDWHMRQLGEQPGRNNHRLGAGSTLASGGEGHGLDTGTLEGRWKSAADT